MKSFFLKLIILSGILFAFQTADQIPWKESRQLTWDDFQGKPDASSPYKAKTESELSIKIESKGLDVTIVMQNCFNKKTSWVKEKRDVLLTHERTHFDISELWARKFKQKLKDKTFAAKSFQNTLNAMHSEINKEARAMQAEYDKETEHSVNEKAQSTWTKKVNADLKSLSEFIPPSITCKLTK